MNSGIGSSRRVSHGPVTEESLQDPFELGLN
jgi:hypothetical protein